MTRATKTTRTMACATVLLACAAFAAGADEPVTAVWKEKKLSFTYDIRAQRAAR